MGARSACNAILPEVRPRIEEHEGGHHRGNRRAQQAWAACYVEHQFDEAPDAYEPERSGNDSFEHTATMP